MPRTKPHSKKTKEKISKGLIRHGMRKTSFYKRWENMKQRCSNPNHNNYKYYGGRGIKVCKRWDKFDNFMEDMLPSYKDGLTIDRVDNDGDYEAENCRWITIKQQQMNRGNNVTEKINGKYFRRCKPCGKTKPIEEFPRAKVYLLGRHYRCNECKIVIDTDYRKRKRDNLLQEKP